MYSAGRQGSSETCGLDAAGLSADQRGRIEVDEYFRTEVPHIYAVGDIIGFPALAATSMEQGRLAALHACGEPVQPLGAPAHRHLQIPEISFVGRTEEQLTATACRSRSACPATGSWPGARSSATPTAC